jgi:hypothetical protein
VNKSYTKPVVTRIELRPREQCCEPCQTFNESAWNLGSEACGWSGENEGWCKTSQFNS